MKIRNTNNCPICSAELVCDPEPQRARQSAEGATFNCYTPLDKIPLHYYTHTVSAASSNKIVWQEFSVDLDTRWVILTNDYVQHKSHIRTGHAVNILEVPTILIPDFPEMEKLKNKIKMAIVFS